MKIHRFIVKETIDVEFHQQRHGIYREIPFRYRDDSGKMITTPTKILSVVDGSGKAWKYKVEKTGPVINIRIGMRENMSRGAGLILSPTKSKM